MKYVCKLRIYIFSTAQAAVQGQKQIKWKKNPARCCSLKDRQIKWVQKFTTVFWTRRFIYWFLWFCLCCFHSHLSKFIFFYFCLCLFIFFILFVLSFTFSSSHFLCIFMMKLAFYDDDTSSTFLSCHFLCIFMVTTPAIIIKVRRECKKGRGWRKNKREKNKLEKQDSVLIFHFWHISFSFFYRVLFLVFLFS